MGENGNLVFLRFIFIFEHVSVNMKAGTRRGRKSEWVLGAEPGSLQRQHVPLTTEPFL